MCHDSACSCEQGKKDLHCAVRDVGFVNGIPEKDICPLLHACMHICTCMCVCGMYTCTCLLTPRVCVCTHQRPKADIRNLPQSFPSFH